MRTALLLIRHCHSTGQLPDAQLTAEGTAAAARLAPALEQLGVDAIYASPFRRARDTVAPFARRKGLEISLDERLIERRLASTALPDWLEHVRRSFADSNYKAPGGESLREAQTRGLAALAEIARHGHNLAAVCTHGNLLSAILRSADANFAFDDWQALGNPDLFEIACDDGDPRSYRRLAITSL